MTEHMGPILPMEDERLQDLDNLSYAELLSKADAHYVKKEYNLALIYKIKATRMTNNPEEKSKCLLGIAGYYIDMAEGRTELADSTRESYLVKAEKYMDLSAKLGVENLPKPRYTIGQPVMYCFLPGLGWRMTSGESAYEQSAIASIEFGEDNSIRYLLDVPSLRFQPGVSEKDLVNMQDYVEYLQRTGIA
jgi:hypothetical protein